MACALAASFLLLSAASAAPAVEPELRPNIVWITSEDHGPHLGCYGDAFAITPNIDRLAQRGLRYTRTWSCAPVCAPARTTLISGLYPPSTGSEHMRSMVPLPAGMKMFPQLLRDAGYFCSNNAKEDYNLSHPGQLWDESSKKAHWRNRKPGQPFFAVFNSEKSHESKIRVRPHEAVHDPASARLPPYHPDTPEVRQDWAQYYDGVSNADADAGHRLKELEEAGLLESTIVFYFSDHGSGMPRNKRWLYTSGLHVPLVISIPEKYRQLRPKGYQAGETSDQRVSFVDFAPTLLSLAGIKPPAWIQGHAFLGPYAALPQQYVYSFRGRMDEKYDLSRGVYDGRYLYIRNYMPHRPQGQYLSYMFQTPTTQVWKKLHVQGKLTPAQDFFWNPKPSEELYELADDPHQIHNLAALAEHEATRARMQKAQQNWAQQIRDVGFLPEGEMHARSQGDAPYDMGHDEARYPFDRVFHTAEIAANSDPAAIEQLKERLQDRDSAVRYWAALGFLIRGRDAVTANEQLLNNLLEDSSPYVRSAAAEGLARHGSKESRVRAVASLLEQANAKNDMFAALAALNALTVVDRSPATKQAISELSKPQTTPHARYDSYIARLLAELK